MGVLIVLISGCGDFFEKKSTENQTRELLNELHNIQDNPHIGNRLPEMYRGEAKRLRVADGVKLFYFARQSSVEELTEMINRQFAVMKHDGKGQTYYEPFYSVSKNASTNQIIVHCPNEAEADKIVDFLEVVDLPPIQVNIDCMILERFADKTLDWETTIKIDNLLGEDITLGGKSDFFEMPDETFVERLLPAFPGASLRESKRSTFGLDVGISKNLGIPGHEFRAVVDLLVSVGYLKVLMNPRLETVNGKSAKIVSRENVPLEKILTKEGFDEPFSLTDYEWVADSLEVTPHVFADGSIGLKTIAQIGSKSKPEGVVQVSVITERTIDIAENRINPGESLVIGGIRKSEQRSVIRGVPFLKDLPIIGVLFSSKDFEERATEVIFILTPSISSGSVEYAQMVDDVRGKFARPKYEEGLELALIDPFRNVAYTERVERKAAKAEYEKLKADIEKAAALEEVEEVKQKLLDAAQEILIERNKAAKAMAEAERVKREAEKAKAEKALDAN